MDWGVYVCKWEGRISCGGIGSGRALVLVITALSKIISMPLLEPYLSLP